MIAEPISQVPRSLLRPEDVVLAVEIVSPGTRRVDRFAKPGEYAAAGIRYYWRIEQDRVHGRRQPRHARVGPTLRDQSPDRRDHPVAPVVSAHLGRVSDGMGEQERFHKGDHVSWASHSGRGHGVVQDEITERTTVRGRTVNASKEEPQYRIRNDDSGKDVAHKPGALRREQG